MGPCERSDVATCIRLGTSVSEPVLHDDDATWAPLDCCSNGEGVQVERGELIAL